MINTPLTLADCLPLAETHWRGSKPLMSQVNKCVRLVGPAREAESLKAADGVKLLKDLRGDGLSPVSVVNAYRMFRRMLELNGVLTTGWPDAPKPPRKVSRQAITEDDLERLIRWFDDKGWPETGDLARLLRATGLRVAIEALNKDALSLEGQYLWVIGKGGHERRIPVDDPEVLALLGDKAALTALRSLSYDGHLLRWQKGVKACGITSRLPTPHAVRHQYATRLLENTGGNLALVSEMLGHASPAVTARYLHISMDSMMAALRGPSAAA